MQSQPRGRPCAPLDPDASKAARLGCDVRAWRRRRGLSQRELGKLICYSAQHVSDVERAKASATLSCIAAMDDALDAQGALVALQPAVSAEREAERQQRAAARRGETLALSALRCEADSDAGDDVQPTNRRGLIGAGAAAALGTAALGPPPAAARMVDPELPRHYERLLALLGKHDAAYGPREVLSVVLHELRVIAEHREVAVGQLRTELMHVEAHWTGYTAWLCEDTGDRSGRDTLLDRTLRLAREADYPDVMAWGHARQAQWSDAPRAVRFGEAGLRTPRAGAHTRALCAARAAYGRARLGSADAAQRLLAEAHELAALESSAPPGTSMASASRLVCCWEARCWSALEPRRGVALYEGVLRDWPDEARDGGLYRARLALACAGAGELDRARAEGRKALAICKQTRSSVAAGELRRLGAVLSS